MPYSLDFRPSALKSLERIARPDQVRLAKAIEGLRTNPHPPAAKKLSGEHEWWRLRVGDYRVIYAIEKQRLVILVLKIGHRREVYR